MTPTQQLEAWVRGENLHNHEREECCPDFACCQPDNHFPTELRKRFQAAHLAGEDLTPYLMMALSGVIPEGVHIAGEGAPQ